MRRPFLAALALVILAGCSLTPASAPTPAPTIRTEGQDVTCAGGDHGIDEVQFGWSWCYPATWKFQERLQPTACDKRTNADGTFTEVCQKPKGVDATFDIVNDVPTGQPGSGDFGFLIVGTYEIGSATDLAGWVTDNIGPDETLSPIAWGDSRSAGIDGQGRRFAMTATHVVEMDVRGDAIAAEMAKRLSTWKFS